MSVRVATVATAFAGVTLALGTAPALAQVTWDFPTAYPATNFHTENIAAFVKDVEAKTGGKLKMTVHANASLFKAPEIKRAIQGGQAQIGEVLLVNFENENPVFGVDGIPFLATGYSQSKKLADAQRPVLDRLLATQGMRLLFTVPWGPQGLYVKKPIDGVDDMKGIKWRAYSPSTARIGQLMGAQPVTVQAAELSQALATGVVESYMSSGSTGFDSKTYEHVKYYYDTQAWLPKNAVIVSQKAFDVLDKPMQEAVLAAAAAAQTAGWKLSEEKTAWYSKALAERGMQILPPSDKLREGFNRIGKTMLDDWLAKAGADGKAIVDAYRQ